MNNVEKRLYFIKLDVFLFIQMEWNYYVYVQSTFVFSCFVVLCVCASMM